MGEDERVCNDLVVLIIHFQHKPAPTGLSTQNLKPKIVQTPPFKSFSLSTLSIRQHIGTLMLTLTTIVVGVFFLIQLPVDLLPSITYPRIGVRLEAPGIGN